MSDTRSIEAFFGSVEGDNRVKDFVRLASNYNTRTDYQPLANKDGSNLFAQFARDSNYLEKNRCNGGDEKTINHAMTDLVVQAALTHRDLDPHTGGEYLRTDHFGNDVWENGFEGHFSGQAPNPAISDLVDRVNEHSKKLVGSYYDWGNFDVDELVNRYFSTDARISNRAVALPEYVSLIRDNDIAGANVGGTGNTLSYDHNVSIDYANGLATDRVAAALGPVPVHEIISDPLVSNVRDIHNEVLGTSVERTINVLALALLMYGQSLRKEGNNNLDIVKHDAKTILSTMANIIKRFRQNNLTGTSNDDNATNLNDNATKLTKDDIAYFVKNFTPKLVSLLINRKKANDINNRRDRDLSTTTHNIIQGLINDKDGEFRRFVLSYADVFEVDNKNKSHPIGVSDKMNKSVDNYIINLKKGTPRQVQGNTIYVLSPPLFMSTIPVVKGATTMCYTDAQGNVQKANLENLYDTQKDQVLRLLYLDVYLHGNNFDRPGRFFGNTTNNHVELTSLSGNITDYNKNSPSSFNVDMKKVFNAHSKDIDDLETFIKNATSKDDDTSGHVDCSPLNKMFSEIFRDSVNGVYYARTNEGKLVAIDSNGVETLVDKEIPCHNKLEDNCYNFGFKDEECKTILQCLLDGDIRSLDNCLDVYKNQSLFQAALKEMSPDPVAGLQVMKRFKMNFKRITDPKYGSILVPQTIDEWLARIDSGKVSVSDEFKAAVKGNKALLDYLAGVLDSIRRSPAVLNKDITKDVYLKVLNKYESHSIPDSYRKVLKPFVQLPKAERADRFTLNLTHLQAVPEASVQMPPPVSIAPRFFPVSGAMLLGGAGDELQSVVSSYINAVSNKTDTPSSSVNDSALREIMERVDSLGQQIARQNTPDKMMATPSRNEKSTQSGGEADQVQSLERITRDAINQITDRISSFTVGGASKEAMSAISEGLQDASLKIDELYLDIRRSFRQLRKATAEGDTANAEEALRKVTAGLQQVNTANDNVASMVGEIVGKTGQQGGATMMVTEEKAIMSNARILRRLFDDVIDELKKQGISIQQSDIDSINAAVENLRKIEIQLVYTHKLINHYLRLVPLLKDADKPSSVGIRDIRDHKDMKATVDQLVQSLKKKENTFFKAGNTIIGKLVGGTYKALVDTLHGKPNNGIYRV